MTSTQTRPGRGRGKCKAGALFAPSCCVFPRTSGDFQLLRQWAQVRFGSCLPEPWELRKGHRRVSVTEGTWRGLQGAAGGARCLWQGCTSLTLSAPVSSALLGKSAPQSSVFSSGTCAYVGAGTDCLGSALMSPCVAHQASG